MLRDLFIILCGLAVLTSAFTVPQPQTDDHNGHHSFSRTPRVISNQKPSKDMTPDSSAVPDQVNNTGILSFPDSASEEFTPWHQERRNRTGDGIFSGNNITVLHQNSTQNCTLQPASLCSVLDLQQQPPQRNKEMRLEAIKSYVLSSLGYRNRHPPQVNKESFMGSSQYAGKVQTITATCGLPVNTDQDTWTTPGFFHVFFDLSSVIQSRQNPDLTTKPLNRSTMVLNENNDGPLPEAVTPRSPVHVTPSPTPVSSRTHQVNIISAKLRLYKLGRGSQAEPATVEPTQPPKPCNDSETAGQPVPTVVSISTTVALVDSPVPIPDEKIRVTVSWYTYPATKNHFKKKLLDTKMISIKEAKWIEFDIRKAVRTWHNKNMNYGLIVEVENEEGDLVDAFKYFSHFPCQTNSEILTTSSNESVAQTTDAPTTTTPVPVIPQTTSETPGTTTSPETVSYRVPMLEICTLTVPANRDAEDYAQQQPTFFPIPIMVHPTQMKQSNPTYSVHPMASTATSGTGEPFMQNDDQPQVPSSVIPYPHRHRQPPKNKLNRSGNQKHHNHRRPHQIVTGAGPAFMLDDDHPLRQILATVASNTNSREIRRPTRGRDITTFNLDDNNTDYSHSNEEDETKRDIIIQKIYITQPQPTLSSSSQESHHSHSSNYNHVNHHLNHAGTHNHNGRQTEPLTQLNR